MNRKAENPASAPDCYDSALRILGVRAHSAMQLQTKLKRKGYEPDTVAETIQKLTSDGLLDENEFAEQFVRSKLRRGLGSMRIARELETKGISSEVARRAVDAEENGESDDRLFEIAKKRHAILSRRDEDEDAVMMRLAAFLSRRGFSNSEVIGAIERLRAAARAERR